MASRRRELTDEEKRERRKEDRFFFIVHCAAKYAINYMQKKKKPLDFDGKAYVMACVNLELEDLLQDYPLTERELEMVMRGWQRLETIYNTRGHRVKWRGNSDEQQQ